MVGSDDPRNVDRTVRVRPGLHEPISDQPGGLATSLEELVDQLALQMAAAWEKGNPLGADEFLHRHPEVAASGQAAARLIYEEFCLRQEHGQPVSVSEITARFPQWQKELEVLLDFHLLIEGPSPAPAYPLAGDTLGDFRLVAPLGHGAQGQVFLATQTSLAHRPLVLKLTPRTGEEHLALARLQHTHIVPLYAVYDFPDRHLRALCMPFLGAVTLDDLMAALSLTPPAQRHGRDIARILSEPREQTLGLPSPHTPEGNPLEKLSYVHAVCCIGAALAEALDYAHERGLVHLDLKPSNVLLGPDGQPLILDFHLARTPIRRGDETPAWLGGTFGFMSPEQRDAIAAVQTGGAVQTDVDGRSDLYSLGLVLYDALGGPRTHDNDSPSVAELRRANPQVSVGLADILAKCLAQRPAERYQRGAALADDLRRHVEDRPLRGVPNRSWRERWRKWRCRRPYGLPLIAVFLALSLTLLGGTLSLIAYQQERRRAAETALVDAQEKIRHEEFDKAIPILLRGQDQLGDLWGQQELANSFVRHLRLAERGRKAQDLHRVTSYLRFYLETNSFSRKGYQVFDAACARLWQERAWLLDKRDSDLGLPLEERLRADLLDLGILWGRVHVRVTEPARKAHDDAVLILVELEKHFGQLRGLLDERLFHLRAAGRLDEAARLLDKLRDLPGETAWEQYALGRHWLWANDIPLARAHLEKPRDLLGFWPDLYLGLCAFRAGEHAQAVSIFSFCLGQERRAEAYYWRARSFAALGQQSEALRDLTLAIRADAKLAAPYLERAILETARRRWTEARQDFHLALEKGANPALVHYHLAEFWLAQDRRGDALTSLDEALRHEPDFAQALKLRTKLSEK